MAHFVERLTKRCSLELDERGVRRRTGWLPRNSRLIFVREPNEHGWTTRWFALLGWDEGQFITVPVLTQAFRVDSDGANHLYTSDPTWNNANNTVEVIGGGASGAVNAGTAHCTGGGGGAYCKITNLTFAAPGTTQATYRVGLGGAAVVSAQANGTDGGQTWFNDTVFPTTGTNKVGAANGVHGIQGAGNQAGGAGGAIANNYPASTGFAGGRGGSLTGASGSGASGGGGAAGVTAGGANGVDSSATTSNLSTAGGDADVGNANRGLGGAAGQNNGTGGTEFDGSHGSGGGGGGNGTGSGVQTAGSGGLYGGGGGGCHTTGTQTSGAGALGLIALTWTPAAAGITQEFLGIGQAIVRARNW